MPPIRTGARDLGLVTHWRYAFVGAGSVLQPCRDAVHLDVGGALGPGCLDQHCGQGDSSAALVAQFPEHAYGHLMDAWLARRDDGQDLRGRQWSPVLVTHRDPDFDAVVSCWLVRALVETGELPPCAPALAGYATLVDRGRYQLRLDDEESLHAAHLAFLAIQNLTTPAGQDPFSWRLQRGFALLDAHLAAVAERQGKPHWALTPQDLLPGRPGATDWRARPDFADAAALLREDRAAFERDAQAAALVDVELPAAGGLHTVRVPAFVAAAPPASKLNKYWVRATGRPYFVCPYGQWGGRRTEDVGDRAVHPRVILSLDPNWRCPATGLRPTLAGLGWRLERKETELRSQRGPEWARGSTPRWTDGSVDNADPWYDGRDQDHTIVDSPRSGTVLPYEAVQRLATGRFWHAHVVSGGVFAVLPLEEAPTRPAGAEKPAAIDGATALLDAWREHSREVAREAALGADLPAPLPIGYALRSDRLRWAPGDHGPVMRILHVEVVDAAATLDDLAAWVEALDRHCDHRAQVLAHLNLAPGAASADRVEGLLTQLCLGSTRPVQTGGTTELVLFNRRALAVRPQRQASTSWSDTSRNWLELLIYAAWQAEALLRFSRQAADAVVDDTGTRVKGSAALRAAFLVFESRYFHVEVVREEAPRAVYLQLREALGLDRLHDKVSGELERVEQVEEGIRTTNMNHLMFFVGLTGIVGALHDVQDLVGWQMAAIPISLVVAVGLYWVFVWARGRR